MLQDAYIYLCFILWLCCVLVLWVLFVYLCLRVLFVYLYLWVWVCAHVFSFPYICSYVPAYRKRMEHRDCPTKFTSETYSNPSLKILQPFPFVLYLLLCTFFSIPSSLYLLLYTLFSVPSSLYPLLYTFFSIPSSMYLLLCTFFSVPSSLYLLLYTFFSVPSSLYLLLCTLFSVPSSLYLLCSLLSVPPFPYNSFLKIPSLFRTSLVPPTTFIFSFTSFLLLHGPQQAFNTAPSKHSTR